MLLDTLRRPVQGDLDRYAVVFRSALQSDNPLLSAALAHLTRKLGKVLRPTLVLLCAREGGTVSDAVLHAAAGLEMLHTASLVHDDVIDESDMRRGQRSVNALFDNKAAVLVGDFVTSKALTEMALTGSLEAIKQTAWLGQQLADGELLQLAATRLTTFEEKPYYEIIAKKTAALFSTCARLGALLGGADRERVGLLERFGHLAGLCFQIRDDLFDFDESLDVGKPKGNDMAEGKLTLPVLYALRDGDERSRQLALKVRNLEASQAEIHELIDFTVRQGGLRYAEDEMQRIQAEALALLPTLHDADVAASLALYIDFALHRTQ